MSCRIRFTCEDCGRDFATKGSLKTHFRIHTGDKPFQCPGCLACFTQLANCTRHIRLVHKDDPALREKLSAMRAHYKLQEKLIRTKKPQHHVAAKPFAAMGVEEALPRIKVEDDDYPRSFSAASMYSTDSSSEQEVEQDEFEQSAAAAALTISATSLGVSEMSQRFQDDMIIDMQVSRISGCMNGLPQQPASIGFAAHAFGDFTCLSPVFGGIALQNAPGFTTVSDMDWAFSISGAL